MYVSKHTQYTGAPAAGTPPAIYGINQVENGVMGPQAGVLGYIVNLNTTNSQPAGSAGTVGGYGIGVCGITSCAATWGGVMATYDTSGQANPPHPQLGLEVDNYAHGTDTGQERVGIEVAAGTPTGTGTMNTVTNGVLFAASGAAGGGIFGNLISGGTSHSGNGITLSSMTLTGVAYNSPGFQVDNVGNLTTGSINTGAFNTTTNAVLVPVGSGIVIGANTGGVGGQMVQLATGGGWFFDYQSSGNVVFRMGSGLTTAFTILAANGATTTGNITAANHLTTASLPSIGAGSTCGTSPPAATAGSSNAAGQFTLGTGAVATTCTVTFAVAYPTAAFCTVTPVTTGVTSVRVSAQSKSAFTITFAPATASLVFQYTCGGN